MSTDDLEQLKQENQHLKKESEELKRKERHLSVINAFATSIIEQNTISDIAWDVAKNVIAKLDLEDCVIYLFDETRALLVQQAAYGPKNPEAFDIKNPITLPLGKGIVGSVAKTGVGEIISDCSKDPRYITDDVARQSEIAVPIIAGGEVIGVIDSEHSEKHFFTIEHLELLTIVASITSSRLSQAIVQDRLEKEQSKLEKVVQKRTRELQKLVEELQMSYDEISSKNKEKEVLLKEIHHRVKNNMQVINSLLSLQSHHVEDPQILKLFKECQNRVLSMALIHEKLYESKDLAHIGIKDYIKILTNSLIRTYELDIPIELDLQLSITTFNIDTLIPLGLIMNECISNSLKYAFAGKEKGEIRIHIERLGSQQYELIIGDNGAGLPEGFHWEQSQSLGMELIRTLTEQLNGTIEQLPQPGTAFRIRFQNIGR